MAQLAARKVKCLFLVTRVTKLQGGSEEITLRAEYSEHDDEEARAFALATPVGDMSFLNTNPDVIGRFEPGDEYFVTLEKRDKE